MISPTDELVSLLPPGTAIVRLEAGWEIGVMTAEGFKGVYVSTVTEMNSLYFISVVRRYLQILVEKGLHSS